MKKLIFILILLAIAGAGGWGYYQHRLELEKQQEGRFSPSPADIYAGIIEAVKPTLDVHGYGLTMLVPGNRLGEFEWDFRGTLGKENVSPPFYGRVTYVCEDNPQSYCWRLDELLINGRTIERISGDAQGLNERETAEGAAVETVEQVAAGFSADDQVGASEISTDPQESETVSENANDTDVVAEVASVASENTVPLPDDEVKIWHSTSDTVNARIGPGTDYKIAFQMPSATPLKLLEEQDGWGQFSYTGPNGKIYSVWIAMTLVESR
ncbi:hypothetical protein TH9_06665 [Thalassospira xiamenensis]|uniref:SH3 domain-containing protein n=1 Tax=Thalassospira xiamenensis TaxID=220697 RepID=UPI000DEE0EA9|nr:SH3 domain-containing protein [Thalassospira xiamenensis]RCK34070.1 hypothetical protein TH9_06665 [Thalassospira xiamenensis]